MSMRLAAGLIALGMVLAAPPPALAAKKKPASPKAACPGVVLCTAACNAAGWCNVAVCRPPRSIVPTLAFCQSGTSSCPPKC
ncbi:MAG: hypothetical protein GHHEDOFH_02196 [Pseudorhodoplanes sp.]|nr:hypothetical protein [Pseudorhodoplanes sp.]